jgi:hypothetical protein
MIRGLHGLLYSSDEGATRAFFRDQLKLPTNDIGGGWLIFDLPEADLGVHPVDGEEGGGTAGTHDVSFYCDDIQGTVAELKARGVAFKGDIHDHGYGWVTYIDVPGGIVVQLYEPKYQKKGAAPKKAVPKKPAPKKKAAPKKAVPKKPAPKKKAAPKKAVPKKPAPAKSKPKRR